MLSTLASALVMPEIVRSPGHGSTPWSLREPIDPEAWLTSGVAPKEFKAWAPSSLGKKAVEEKTVLRSTEVWTLLVGFSCWMILGIRGSVHLYSI